MSLAHVSPQNDPDRTCYEAGHEWEYDFGWPPHDEPESRACIHCGTVQYPYAEGWRT